MDLIGAIHIDIFLDKQKIASPRHPARILPTLTQIPPFRDSSLLPGEAK